MTTGAAREQLAAEIATAPDDVLDEVLDFLLFLKSRASRDTAIASECSLGQDWLKPEEDAAWADL